MPARALRCLAPLSEKQIWWRRQRTQKSGGILVLDLKGNVRPWITTGWGGGPDRRARDREHAERGLMAGRPLPAPLRCRKPAASWEN